jgi:hypothetical protein
MPKIKTITYTVKMDQKIRMKMVRFCKINGLFIGKFIERAIMHEIEREKLKQNEKEL